MKISCERCGVEFDADGHAATAACPSCKHENAVPVAASGPREISLSSLDDEPIDLGASAAPSAPPPASAPRAAVPLAPPSLSLTEDALGDVDFASIAAPTPAKASPPAAAPPPLDLDSPLDLDAPVAAAPIALAPPPPRVVEEPDLPTPAKKVPVRPAPPPPMKDIVDLPAPRAPAGRAAAPERPDGGVDLPAPKVDLPRPVSRPSGRPPVPGAKPPVPPSGAKAPPPPPRKVEAPPPSSSSSPEIVMPLDLDAPDVDDAPQDVVDLPAPRVDADLPAPRMEQSPARDHNVDLPTPRADRSVDLPRPRASAAAPVLTPDTESLADLLEGPGDAPVAPAEPVEKAEKAGSTKSRLPLLIGGGAVVLLAGGGIAAWQLGAFGGGSRTEDVATITAARHALGDDTSNAFRKTTTTLKLLASGDHASEPAVLLEAQAHLLLAHLGVTGELALGKALLDRPPGKVPDAVDRAGANGLRALDEGDLVNARKILKEQAADAAAQSYLGFVEVEARDPVAAQAAFKKALALEPTRVQASYGLALATERSGDDKAAGTGYDKIVATSPDHLRARLGQLRVAARNGDVEASQRLEALMTSQASAFTRGEIAEANATLGQMAVDAGRRDEAEDRFKKALATDADPARSHIAWDASLGLARLRVQGGHSADAIDDLRKLMALESKGIETRVLLAQALIDKGDVDGVDALLSAIDTIKPKEARIALLRGRLIESRMQVSNEDRQKAVDDYKQATAAEPKLIEGWTALAKAQHALGKNAEALEALSNAANALAGNGAGAAIVGEAYLAIGQPAEAETRFRAVLAAGKAGSDQLPLWIGLGESLEAQNKLDEAKKVYAEAQQLAPKSSVLAEKQARIAVRQNQLEEAKRLYDEALKLGTPTAALRLAAAELALMQHRNDDARALAESVVKDDDRSAVANLLMAKAELAGNHPDEAIGLARRAAVLQDLPEAHYVLGQIMETQNKLDGAASEYNLARRPPTAEKAALGRARLLVRMGKTQDALGELAPLTKAGPLRAEALMLTGDCYADLQQNDKARRAYEDAVRASPDSADAGFKYGRSLMDAGSRGPGVAALERAVKLAEPKTSWLSDAWLLLADGYRMGHKNDPAVRAYKKYLELAPTTAPMRSEAQRQLSILGGTP